jgi:hypothetical protein
MGRQWARRCAYLCMSTGLALVLFYFLHFEQATVGQLSGPWQFPFGARLILVGAKVTLAFWTVLWVLRRKTIPAPVERIGMAMSTMLFTSIGWSFYEHF